jgi:hypothetical protein
VKIRTKSHFVRALAALLYAFFVAACGAGESELPEEDVGAAAEAYSGTIATLVDTPAPRGAPSSWSQPDSEGIVGQNGYCGATAASNLLGWYNLRVSPREAIDGHVHRLDERRAQEAERHHLVRDRSGADRTARPSPCSKRRSDRGDVALRLPVRDQR